MLLNSNITAALIPISLTMKLAVQVLRGWLLELEVVLYPTTKGHNQFQARLMHMDLDLVSLLLLAMKMFLQARPPGKYFINYTSLDHLVKGPY